MVATTTGKASELITFSRGSLATVTDSDGKIKWAPHNLLLASEQFDASAWTKAFSTVSANVTSAPNGTTTADKLVENTTTNVHTARQVFTVSGSTRYTLSIYAKAAGRNWMVLDPVYPTVANNPTYFDLQNGVVGTNDPDNTPTITSIGNGWYLCQVSHTTQSAQTSLWFQVEPASADGTDNYLGNGTDGIFVWGAHLYRSDLGGMQANASAYPYYNPSTPKNLLGYSEDFSNAAWVKSAATVTANALAAPNGSLTADKVVATAASGGHAIYQGIAVTAAPYVFSFFAKAGEYNLVQIADGGNGQFYASYNLANGTVVSGANGGTRFVSAAIADAGNGWYRCSALLQGMTANPAISIIGYPAGATLNAFGASFTGDGVSGIYLWGAQLSDSASLDSYSPVFGAAPSAAAYHGPRLDYDPVTLSAKGLLVEEARTNTLLRSEEFDNAAWSKTELTVTANAIASPDGTVNADLVIPSVNNLSHWIAQDTSITTGTAYAQSIYAKAGGYNWLQITESSQFGAVQYANINLTTGQIGAASGYSASTVSITSAGNGWWRISVLDTSTGSGSGRFLFVVLDANTASRLPAFAGDGVSGVYLYGAQLEAGSFATSYIPTAAATVTRNADVASVGVSQFPYSATEGTLVAHVQRIGTSSTSDEGTGVELNSGQQQVNVIQLVFDTGSFNTPRGRLFSPSGAYTQVDGPGGVAPNFASGEAPRKIGLAYKSGDSAVAYNGSVGTTNTSTFTPPAPTQLRLSTAAWGVQGSDFNGYIRQITYLPRRLTNAELQSRTA